MPSANFSNSQFTAASISSVALPPPILFCSKSQASHHLNCKHIRLSLREKCITFRQNHNTTLMLYPLPLASNNPQKGIPRELADIVASPSYILGKGTRWP